MIENMILVLVNSIFIGLIFGFLYGFLFIDNLKKLYLSRKNNIKKNFFKIILFSIFCHILLISIFIFLVFTLKINLLIFFVLFIIAFWIYILKSTKDYQG